MTINFKDLVSSHETTRKKALKSAKIWLSNQSHLEEEFLLKTCHALFYCLWMQDKLHLQQDLAQKIAKLLMEIKSHDLLTCFFTCFLKIIANEWLDLDRYRMDKFYFLLKQLILCLFKRLQSENWNSSLVKALVCDSLLLNLVVLGQESSQTVVPISLRNFVLENYLPSLLKVLLDDDNDNGSSSLERSQESDAVSLALGSDLTLMLFEQFLFFVCHGAKNEIVLGIQEHILKPLCEKKVLANFQIETLGKRAFELSKNCKSSSRRKILRSFCRSCGVKYEEEEEEELTITSSGFFVSSTMSDESDIFHEQLAKGNMQHSRSKRPLPWLCVTSSPLNDESTPPPKKPSRSVNWGDSKAEKHFFKTEPPIHVSLCPVINSPLSASAE